MAVETRDSNVLTPAGNAVARRRDFVKGLGLGALGLGLFGAAPPQQRDSGGAFVVDDEELDFTPIAPCPVELWSISRTATQIEQATVNFCNPCDCTPIPHFNLDGSIRFRTSFSILEGLCDELVNIPLTGAMTLEWRLFLWRLRLNGPCETPVGFFDGTWVLRDPSGAIKLASGKIKGLIGHDPSNVTPTCCAYPRVCGTLQGLGRVNTPLQDCRLRMCFDGFHDVGETPCHINGWNVNLVGMVECPCQGGPGG